MFQTMTIGFPNSARKEPGLWKEEPLISYYLGSTGDASFVNIVTTPKSGTHLLMKTLKLLGVSYKTKSLNMKTAPHLCQYAPLLPYDFLIPEKVKESFDINEKYIITIRDPKDYLISFIQWINVQMDKKAIPQDKDWMNTSMEEKLDQLLAGGEAVKLEPFKDAPWSVGNYLVAERVLLLALPNILFLKFEDLIGPGLGGSSKEKQIEALTKLCNFTGTKVTAGKISALIKAMPGGTLTYIDQKKVGKWQDYFTDKHMTYYNQRFARLTRNLGYTVYHKDQ